eukprot:m.208741 g.208741  ORF g.208741 m.208741 type:complete len:119 (-) comp25430_c0_seq1:281-637(-)
MVVNATMLVAELTQRLPKCQNDCWVGTVTHWKDYAFTAGGWCMDGGLARRVYDLLNRVNDTELFGKRNLADDVGVGWLMRQRFGVDPTDSIGWHCHTDARLLRHSIGAPEIPFPDREK